ncbi:MAG TPA: NFACT family protein, partial [Clostridia bacterium]|nr:NFACT family protein [Clostridia bacterium]
MAFDGIMLRGITNELNGVLRGARIEKIMQPDKDTVVLSLHTQNGSKKLLICINASSARMHLTENTLKNPDTPPMFCMLMRKHLTGARIKSVTQHGLDRSAEIAIDAANELGDRVLLRLIVELMGKHSN